MTEKCMANCMAKPIHLHLRNKIFYYRVELPRVNNKRRYKIISLHTQNYYEAQEKIVLSRHTYGRQLFPFNQVEKRIKANDLIYALEKRKDTTFIVTSGISNLALRFKTGTQSEFVIINIKKGN